MIALFTDFGMTGPYIGQMKAVLYRHAPNTAVIDLMADAPSHDPRAAAYLLNAYAGSPFPSDTVYLCVVDPGVGGSRRAIAVHTERGWFVGPDNGLFNRIAQTAGQLDCWEITWRPDALSASFHGRDLFAPVAASLAGGDPVPGRAIPAQSVFDPTWPDSLPEVLYIDHFGNAITGISADKASPERGLRVGGMLCRHAMTFSDAAEGSALWYTNSNGLVEIAVNRGSADQVLGLARGDRVELV